MSFGSRVRPSESLFRELGEGGEGSPLDFLKSTLAPMKYSTNPPSLFDRMTTLNPIVYSNVFTPGDDQHLVGEMVKTATGIFLWLPLRGLTSMTRMGFVQANKVSAALPFTIGAWKLKWTIETAIPYTQAENVKYSPDFSTNFSVVRASSGYMSLVANTIGTTNAALSGLVSSGLIADTRDVSQVNGSAFTSDSINTLAQTGKDAIKDHNMWQGVASVMGSDIPQQFGPADPNITLEYKEFRFSHVSSGQNTDGAVPLNAATDPIFKYHGFYSPWGVELDSSATFSTNIENVNTGPANIMTRGFKVSVDISLDWSLCLTGDATLPSYSESIVFTPVYAVCDKTGLVTYSTSSTGATTYEYLNGAQFDSLGWTLNAAGLKTYRVEHECLPPSLTNGFPTAGLFVGVLIQVYFSNTGTAFSSIAPNIPSLFSLLVRCNTPDMYLPGELGPAHVHRYDDIAANTVVKMEGRVNVQVVPEGNVASFIRGQMNLNSQAVNVNILSLLNLLYNANSTQFKRIWKLQDFEDLVRNKIGVLTRDDFMQHGPKIAEAARASGMFEAGGPFGFIGKAIGSGIDALTGNTSGRGADIGEALGGATDLASMFAVAGEYPEAKRRRSEVPDTGSMLDGYQPTFESAGRYHHRRR